MVRGEEWELGCEWVGREPKEAIGRGGRYSGVQVQVEQEGGKEVEGRGGGSTMTLAPLRLGTPSAPPACLVSGVARIAI